MPEFPPKPVSPREFLEQFVPKAFSEIDRPAALDDAEVALGVRLEGEGGGEWRYELRGGELSVAATSRSDTALTLVQTVDDWRGALWEGRGGVFGRIANALFRPGQSLELPGPLAAQGPPDLAALGRLASLDGLVRLTVIEEGGSDWSLGIKLGPGEIPDEPTTSVAIAAEDIAAMEAGSLDPMQAFMAGKIRVEGDMTLFMQMSAAGMQPRSASGSQSSD